MWRGHNYEWIFRTNKLKSRYLELLGGSLDESDFLFHSYCLMNNHNHFVGEVGTVHGLSSMLQTTHSRYAQEYNRQNKRRGAVGMDRPKTLAVQSDSHLMNAVFYCDANPVRAGIVRHPRDYCWSSYSYYAFGKTNTSLKIAPFDWYLKLGSTPSARQRAYRRLCDAYLRHEGLIPKPGLTLGYYIGDDEWIQRRRLRHTAEQETLKKLKSPPRGECCRNTS
jgi:putative transposase